jgi:hypothetical protein
MTDEYVIIGIDAAVADANVGLARAVSSASGIAVKDVLAGYDDRIAAAWVDAAGPNLVLAIDAPLGWPDDMRSALSGHNAGSRVLGQRDEMFARLTDREIRRVTRKNPLEVGADRIARTAHRALELLDALRIRTGRSLPLAWLPGGVGEGSVIEVYPGATLAALGAGTKARGYKKDPEVRNALVALLERFEIHTDSAHREIARKSDHALDAVLCALAGHHFVQGRCLRVPAEHEQRARREGWIWTCSSVG